jgi:hypothetical protein
MKILSVSNSGDLIVVDEDLPKESAGRYHILEKYSSFLKPLATEQIIKAAFCTQRIKHDGHLIDMGITLHDRCSNPKLCSVVDSLFQTKQELFPEDLIVLEDYQAKLIEWQRNCLCFSLNIWRRDLFPVLISLNKEIDVHLLESQLLTYITIQAPSICGEYELHDKIISFFSERLNYSEDQLLDDVNLYQSLAKKFPKYSKTRVCYLFDLMKKRFSTPLKALLNETENIVWNRLGFSWYFNIRKKLIVLLSLVGNTQTPSSVIDRFFQQVQRFLPLNKHKLSMRVSDKERSEDFMSEGICVGIVTDHLIKKRTERLDFKETLPFELSDPVMIPLTSDDTKVELYHFSSYSSSLLSRARYHQAKHNLRHELFRSTLFEGAQRISSFLEDDKTINVSIIKAVKEESLPIISLKEDYFLPANVRKKIGVEISSSSGKCSIQSVDNWNRTLDAFGVILYLSGGTGKEHVLYLDFKEHYVIDPSGLLIVFSSQESLITSISTVLQVLRPENEFVELFHLSENV